MKKLPRKARSRSGKPDRVSAREDRRRPRLSRELSVIYEDDAVVVLDKPAGLLAVPIKGSDTPSALSLLVARLKLKRQRALVVHRIDRFASGALLFGKTGPDRDALVRQFLERTPVRRYLAVVRGRLGVKVGTLVHYFRREGMFQQLRTARDPQAARAELRYSVERLFADASLVRVELVTGLQDNIYVADRGNHRIQAFDRNGKFLRQITIDVPVPPDARPAIGNKTDHPSGSRTPGSPWAICITPPPHQVLFSSDAFPGRIYKLGLDGKVLGMFGKSGKQLGQFGWIHEIACPSENELYVAELLNWRMQKILLEAAH